MKNFIQKGDVVTVAAPEDKLSGVGVEVGASLFGVATHDALSGANLEILTTGVVTLPRDAADVFAVGDLVYWDDTNDTVTIVAAGSILIGVAMEAQAAAAGTILVRLNGSYSQ